MSRDEKILLEKLERATGTNRDSDLEKFLLQMLERATNTDRDSDELSIQFFCNIVKTNSKMIQKAHELIIEKIRNGNSSISMKALALLGECMTKCGTDFQNETANFRFLNELIRLVSSKYEGNQTPAALKEKILELLTHWTIEFPKKSKIKKVHELLLREVNSDKPEAKTNANANANAKPKNVLGIDEEVLAKLLRSNDPEELKRANLYIGEQVKKDALRSDLCKHKDDLQEINNTILILNEMLDNYSPLDANATETIKDLYKNCKNSKKLLKSKTELLLHADASLISDTLQTDDSLQLVINKYKSIIAGSTEPYAVSSSSSSSEKVITHSNNTDLLQDLNIKPTEIPTKVRIEGAEKTSLDELCDIFANVNYNEKSLMEMNTLQQPDSLSLLPTNTECLQPAIAPLMPSIDLTNGSSNANDKNHVVDKQNLSGFEEIDRISEQLLKESLQKIKNPDAQKKDDNMLPLMELTKGSLETELSSVSPPTSEPAEATAPNLDDQIINPAPACTENKKNIHLADIEVAIDDVTPRSDVINVFQDPDLDINLVYADNRPAKDVSVMLLIALNKSNLEMKNFRLEARARKRCKVRLLEPTDNHIAAKKPFLPPNSIIQVLLLLNPTHEKTDVTLLVEYVLGADPDPVNESILIKDIPYVE